MTTKKTVLLRDLLALLTIVTRMIAWINSEKLLPLHGVGLI